MSSWLRLALRTLKAATRSEGLPGSGVGLIQVGAMRARGMTSMAAERAARRKDLRVRRARVVRRRMRKYWR